MAETKLYWADSVIVSDSSGTRKIERTPTGRIVTTSPTLSTTQYNKLKANLGGRLKPGGSVIFTKASQASDFASQYTAEEVAAAGLKLNVAKQYPWGFEAFGKTYRYATAAPVASKTKVMWGDEVTVTEGSGTTTTLKKMPGGQTIPLSPTQSTSEKTKRAETLREGRITAYEQGLETIGGETQYKQDLAARSGLGASGLASSIPNPDEGLTKEQLKEKYEGLGGVPASFLPGTTVSTVYSVRDSGATPGPVSTTAGLTGGYTMLGGYSPLGGGGFTPAPAQSLAKAEEENKKSFFQKKSEGFESWLQTGWEKAQDSRSWEGTTPFTGGGPQMILGTATYGVLAPKAGELAGYLEKGVVREREWNVENTGNVRELIEGWESKARKATVLPGSVPIPGLGVSKRNYDTALSGVEVGAGVLRIIEKEPGTQAAITGISFGVGSVLEGTNLGLLAVESKAALTAGKVAKGVGTAAKVTRLVGTGALVGGGVVLAGSGIYNIVTAPPEQKKELTSRFLLESAEIGGGLLFGSRTARGLILKESVLTAKGLPGVTGKGVGPKDVFTQTSESAFGVDLSRSFVQSRPGEITRSWESIGSGTGRVALLGEKGGAERFEFFDVTEKQVGFDRLVGFEKLGRFTETNEFVSSLRPITRFLKVSQVTGVETRPDGFTGEVLSIESLSGSGVPVKRSFSEVKGSWSDIFLSPESKGVVPFSEVVSVTPVSKAGEFTILSEEGAMRGEFEFGGTSRLLEDVGGEAARIGTEFGGSYSFVGSQGGVGVGGVGRFYGKYGGVRVYDVPEDFSVMRLLSGSGKGSGSSFADVGFDIVIEPKGDVLGPNLQSLKSFSGGKGSFVRGKRVSDLMSDLLGQGKRVSGKVSEGGGVESVSLSLGDLAGGVSDVISGVSVGGRRFGSFTRGGLRYGGRGGVKFGGFTGGFTGGVSVGASNVLRGFGGKSVSGFGVVPGLGSDVISGGKSKVGVSVDFGFAPFVVPVSEVGSVVDVTSRSDTRVVPSFVPLQGITSIPVPSPPGEGSDVVPPPPVVPGFFGLPGFSLPYGGKGRRGQKGPGVVTGYTPSLEAKLFGVKAKKGRKKTEKVFKTGLVLRPIF